jgi:hypothetical protein
MYVYRDTSGDPDDPATAAPGDEPDERDASYWYDLSGGDSAHVPEDAHILEEARGPFEPLVSSNGPPPGTALPSAPIVDQAAPAAETRRTGGRHAAPDVAGHDAQEASTHAQARRLEQIKDFYLTAEAIGEQNVDKHFDQLLAQQRELIGEYFKQSSATRPGDGLTAQAGAQAGAQPGAQAGAQPGADPDVAGGPDGSSHADSNAEPSHSASVIAEQPRVW